jgi:hypothetical protein
MDIADLLFIGAEPMEFEGATRYWQNIEPVALPVHWARRARWKDKHIVAIANGAGARRSALAASTVKFERLVSMGFCGALDPDLQIGDIVVGSSSPKFVALKPHATGVIASIDHIAQTAEEKSRLRAGGAIAVEMELAGLSGLPCYAIKAVSDLAGENFANDLNSVLNPDGRIDITQLVWHACLRPVARFSGWWGHHPSRHRRKSPWRPLTCSRPAGAGTSNPRW